MTICKLMWIFYGKCTINAWGEILLWLIPCAKDKSQRLYTAIGMLSFKWFPLFHTKGNIPKAISASHCKHHTVKLWCTLQLELCQYKSSKMLSGIWRFILPSVPNSSICLTCCCRENVLKSYNAWDSSDNTRIRTRFIAK